MSPTRRLLLQAVALVAVIVVGTAVLANVLNRPPAGAAVPAADQALPGPVLLVPGYGGATGAIEVLAAGLQAAGRTTVVVALPGDGTGDLRQAAAAVGAAVGAALAGGAPSVDLVGYSAGGVTVRLWVKDHPGQVRRVVTLGSPHHGTKLAALGAAISPGSCPTACQQLVPGSDLLDGLNKDDETPDGTAFLALWTEQDETVTPPESAALDGAENLSLQALCPGLSVSHSALPRDPVVQRIVVGALGTTPLTRPGAAACG